MHLEIEGDLAVMSDSEQRQLHVPYPEYHSQNTSNPTTLIDTDALVDLSINTNCSVILSNGEPSNLLPDVEFAPNLSVEQQTTIGSSGTDRESQPLLGRLEIDATFNRFPGMT